MKAPPTFCLADGCRFSEGYDPAFHLRPPTGMKHAATLHAFAAEQRLGYRHYAKHFPGLEGADVVERLHLAWGSARVTVVRTDKVTLMWVVDHDAFSRDFGGRRVMLVSTRCADYAHDCRHCCAGCGRCDRPEQMTVRSVQYWRPFRWQRILYPSDERDAVIEYLEYQPERWIRKQVAIARAPRRVDDPASPFAYEVLVVVDRDHPGSLPRGHNVKTIVIADDAQRRLIEDDPDEFVRCHEVLFRARAPSGRLEAYFVRISP